MKKSLLIKMMAFYHENGLVPSWKQAGTFAGIGGHIATLPDIINARLSTKPGDIPWETWFTTSSSEYMWKSKGGNPIIIVAHENSPMATLNGSCKSYRYSYSDKTRNNEGGRISEKEFYDLESGKYGEVSIIDLEELAKKYKYLFCNTTIRASEALNDPLMKARLGKNAESYINYHAKFAKEYHLEKGHGNIEDPYILEMGGAPCPYYGLTQDVNHGKIFKVTDFERIQMPFAHLLSIGQLVNLHHEGTESLVSDIGCHQWSHGTKFVGVRKEGNIENIHPGPDLWQLMKSHWKLLMKSTFEPPQYPLYLLVKMGKNTWFTQRRKIGACMDNGEAEFHVKNLRKFGKPEDFITTIGGYHGFFKYDIKEIESINNYDCNLYLIVGDTKILSNGGSPKYHKTKVQFYKGEIDTTKRLITEKELRNDYDKLMFLLEQ